MYIYIYIYIYISTWLQTEIDTCTSNLCAVIAAWLNASKRSRDGIGMNRSDRGLSVKHVEQSKGLDTALYKNVPFLSSSLVKKLLNDSICVVIFLTSD